MNQAPLWDDPPRPIPSLHGSAGAILVEAAAAGAQRWCPLFSGGHDSLCATYLASQHPLFDGRVYHIDTGIGAKATRAFVNDVCAEYGWTLVVLKSKATYERFVTRLGFPGPGTHQWVYNWLKDRCVSQLTTGSGSVALITGCREQESTRRMGTAAAIKIGEPHRKTGKVLKKRRIWTAPCVDWSSSEQRAFMLAEDLPRNPIKDSPLQMSGECFCGAFASPDELSRIRHYAPDVAEEIDRLTALAMAAGTHAVWGTRPDRRKGLIVAQTGPLCASCDVRAASAGLLFAELDPPDRRGPNGDEYSG